MERTSIGPSTPAARGRAHHPPIRPANVRIATSANDAATIHIAIWLRTMVGIPGRSNFLHHGLIVGRNTADWLQVVVIQRS